MSKGKSHHRGHYKLQCRRYFNASIHIIKGYKSNLWIKRQMVMT